MAGSLTGLCLHCAGAVIAITMVCLLALALSCLSNLVAHAMGRRSVA